MISRKVTALGFLLTVVVAALRLGVAAETMCPAGLKADEIARQLVVHNNERARDLEAFEGTREYSLDYSGFPSFHSATMQVKAIYQAPGTKRFTVLSESGSKLLRDHVLHKLLESEADSANDPKNRKAIEVTTENYRFAWEGCESANGRMQYKMAIAPLRQNKYLYRGFIWIDAQDFAVTRIEAEPAESPSLLIKRTRIHHQYEKIGEFYLPSLNQTISDMRLGGKAVLTIRYHNYKLQTAAGPGISAAQAGN